MFKFNNEDTRMTLVSIVNFEHVIAGWDVHDFPNTIPCFK